MNYYATLCILSRDRYTPKLNIENYGKPYVEQRVLEGPDPIFLRGLTYKGDSTILLHFLFFVMKHTIFKIL